MANDDDKKEGVIITGLAAAGAAAGAAVAGAASIALAGPMAIGGALALGAYGLIKIFKK